MNNAKVFIPARRTLLASKSRFALNACVVVALSAAVAAAVILTPPPPQPGQESPSVETAEQAAPVTSATDLEPDLSVEDVRNYQLSVHG